MNSIEIAQKILNRIELEIQKNKPQKARACIVVKQGGKQKIFWLLPSGLQGASQYQRNIQGDIVNVVTGESRFLNTPGEFVVSKNSAFADAIVDLNGEFREISYQIDNRLVRLAVIANSNYAIKDKLQNFDAYQGFIETEKFDGFKFEKSLRQQIAYEQRLIELNEDVQDDDNLDKIIEIRKQQDEILEKRKNDRKRRRTNTGIREQFLLDASQNKIKKLKLYNGPIIINGGPGTGKTTLLIHRIQYMLDPEINIDYIVKSFSKPEIDFLRNQKTGWIFFSPTNLLKEYLKNAMVAEGLRATNETVKTWEQQRKTITAAFRLYNSETERPFLAYKHEQSLWELSVKDLVEIQKEFDKHLSQYFIDKIKTIEKVSFIKSPWKKEVEEIMFSIKSLIDTFRLDQLIIRLNLLHEKYTGLKNLIEKEYRETLEDIAGRCQKKLSPEEKEWFVNYLKQSRNKQNRFQKLKSKSKSKRI
jgi:ABC-type lipoprotein export system ATPase subunit